MNNKDMICKVSKKSDYQLLMMKQLLPILLYIRNFSEYNRHRPAETRLSARRRARAEQIEFRMKELERQHKQTNSNANYSDRHYHLFNTNHSKTNVTTNTNKHYDYCDQSQYSSYTASRRSSEHSCDESLSAFQEKDTNLQFNDLEDKYKKSITKNNQLENDIRSYSYQIELFKDIMEELEEKYIRLQIDIKEKSRSYDQLKRDFKRLEEQNESVKECLRQREALIMDAGLVIIDSYETNLMDRKRRQSLSDESGSESGISESVAIPFKFSNNASLISQEAAQLLTDVEGNCLESKLKTLFAEKRFMLNEINRLKSELEIEKQRTTKLEELTLLQGSNQSINCSEAKTDAQREANKLVSDYRFKLKKCEQEISSLQASISRYETQISECRNSAEEAEKLEDELKADKRKLQRELRETLSKIRELETSNAHLQKRIDKLKSSRSEI